MSDIQHDLQNRHPSWKVNVSKSGIAQWIDIVTPSDRRFTVQVTPDEGVGVSEIGNSEIDFGGHDEVFDNLADAISHIESQAAP